MIRYLKNGVWLTSVITIPESVDPEKYVEKHIAKDFVIYMEAVKSTERLRKELLVSEAKFDLSNRGQG
jgi:hypothetical protein